MDGAGRTLLHEAASRGRKRLVEWLAQRPEIDVGMKDAAGKTALDEAKTSHNSTPKIVDYLKERMRRKMKKAELEEGMRLMSAGLRRRSRGKSQS